MKRIIGFLPRSLLKLINIGVGMNTIEFMNKDIICNNTKDLIDNHKKLINNNSVIKSYISYSNSSEEKDLFDDGLEVDLSPQDEYESILFSMPDNIEKSENIVFHQESIKKGCIASSNSSVDDYTYYTTTFNKLVIDEREISVINNFEMTDYGHYSSDKTYISREDNLFRIQKRNTLYGNQLVLDFKTDMTGLSAYLNHKILPTNIKQLEPKSDSMGRDDLRIISKKLLKIAFKDDVKQLFKLMHKLERKKYLMEHKRYIGNLLFDSLRVAICHNSKNVVKQLINLGLDISNRRIPYEAYTSDENFKMVRFLLSKGANPNQRYSDNSSPLSIAKESNASKIEILLLQHGSRQSNE